MVLLIRAVTVCGIKNSERLELSIREASWQILQSLTLPECWCVSVYTWPATFPKFRKKFSSVVIVTLLMPVVPH